MQILSARAEKRRADEDFSKRVTSLAGVVKEETAALQAARDKAAAEYKAVFDDMERAGLLKGTDNLNDLYRKAETDPVYRRAVEPLRSITQRLDREEKAIQAKAQDAWAELAGGVF